MNELIKILDGNKTYLTGIATIILSVLNQYGYIDPDLFWGMVTGLAGLGAIFMRMGVKKSGLDIAVAVPEVVPTETIPTTQEALISLIKDIAAQAQKDKPKE